jgi:hypothetical protein
MIAGVNERVGKLFEEAIVVRLAGERDRVAVRVRAVAPAIENSQNKRLLAIADCKDNKS